MAGEEAFEVSVETIPARATVVHVAGELDLATAAELEAALAARTRDRGLVVDLSGCTFVDSTCVRVIVSVARETLDSGERAAIVATDPGVLRVLEITALDTLVPVMPSVEGALALVTDEG